MEKLADYAFTVHQGQTHSGCQGSVGHIHVTKDD